MRYIETARSFFPHLYGVGTETDSVTDGNRFCHSWWIASAPLDMVAHLAAAVARVRETAASLREAAIDTAISVSQSLAGVQGLAPSVLAPSVPRISPSVPSHSLHALHSCTRH